MQLAHNSTDTGVTKPVAEDFWEKFQAEVLKNENDLQQLELFASLSMPALHQSLCSHRDYQHKMARLQYEEVKGYSLSYTIFKNDHIRVNLNAIEPGRGLPLHDHPGSAGLSYIIQGQADIVLCNHATTNQANRIQHKLTVAENKRFATGDVSCFTKDQNNIHGINAISERCIILVVHSYADMNQAQSFYFTRDPAKTVGTQLVSQRLSARRIKNFSHTVLNKRQEIKNET